MTLHDRLRALTLRCEELSTRQERVRDTTTLDSRLSAFEQASTGLPDAAATATLLRASGVAVSFAIPEIAKSRERIQRFAPKLASERSVSTFAQNRDWSFLLKDLEKIEGAALGALQEAWAAYARGLYSGEPPHVIEGRMPKTPVNAAALETFKLRYREFRASVADIPQDKSQIEAARSAAARLLEALAGFKLDESQAVTEFFAALSRGGAPIELLTNEVRDYLQNNGLLSQYKIVLRTQ